MIEVIAYCEVCEDIADPELIGEDCESCGDGFYEKFLRSECDLGQSCNHDLHHFGYNAHIGMPEDFDEGEEQ